jgi:two-component system NtrC family sensor kinase
MFAFQRLSINGKLWLLVLFASSVAVLLSCIAFVSNDVWMIRKSMVKQISALAEVLGANSTAALDFDDAKAATEILASLKLQQSVDSAAVFNAEGHLFAAYHRQGTNSTLPSTPRSPGHEFTAEGYLDVVHPIVRENRLLGSIYLHASMSELHDQILGYVGIVVLVMAVSLGAAFAFSIKLHQAISLPILHLAETARRISDNRDYSIRVSTNSTDELGRLYVQFNDMLSQIQAGELALQEAHSHLEEKVKERTHQLSDAVTDLNREVAERTRAENELKNVHQQLMDAARRAGMAEIATGVLHNIGNVLNSINVSASVAVDRLRGARIDQLVRATVMLEQHRDHLADFITSDPKGKQLPTFLSIVATHLDQEKTEIIGELENLTSKIDHVKTIVATQQSYAGVAGVTETFDVAASVDDALKLNATTFDRHRIEIVRDYAPLPKVQLDKQKLLQILVNLVKNGKDALIENEMAEHRQLTFRTRQLGVDRLQIQIIDNGVGIKPENLTRIFSHGFTTKKNGHGFGLHSCANAAREMGGGLTAESNGPGQGATFTLELPFTSHQVEEFQE